MREREREWGKGKEREVSSCVASLLLQTNKNNLHMPLQPAPNLQGPVKQSEPMWHPRGLFHSQLNNEMEDSIT